MTQDQAITQGKTFFEDDRWTIPEHISLTGSEDPENYIVSPGIRNAVKVALALGQPLLVTGEPGTGKTRLARRVAHELDLNYLEFHTKTTSTAADLFYHYDALRRFQDVQMEIKLPLSEYISLRALGKAILLANPAKATKEFIPGFSAEGKPTRSVVLIDEIDKAPRDLPNDILNEIENMRFQIKEDPDREPFRADPEYRPVLIMTSNSEKNLPDAFLRRCVFFHIPFPEDDMLKDIVRKRFGEENGKQSVFSTPFLEKAVSHFRAIRKLNLRKKPATAEFIGWIGILNAMDVDFEKDGANNRQKLEKSSPVLAKNRDDLEKILQYVSEHFKKA